MNAAVISTRLLSRELADQITSSGMNLLVHDFIEKGFTEPPDLSELKFAPHIIITSVAGITAFMNVLNKYALPKERYQIYCLEQETCAEALRQGLRVIGTAGTASLLADVIITHKTVRELTFICSNLRRDELPDKLRAADRLVHEWKGYSVTANPIRIPYTGFVLFYSPSGVDSFLILNPSDNLEAVCIGETTAGHARQRGFKKVYTSDKSTIESVVNKVIQIFSNQ